MAIGNVNIDYLISCVIEHEHIPQNMDRGQQFEEIEEMAESHSNGTYPKVIHTVSNSCFARVAANHFGFNVYKD